MNHIALLTIILPALCLTMARTLHAEIVVDFESVPLGAEGFFNGPVLNPNTGMGPFGGTELFGTFDSGGVGFSNNYNQDFMNWSGFAVSNRSDTTTAGFGNQFSAFPGSGATGSANYAIASDYRDLVPNILGLEPFNRNSVAQLRGLPSIYLPPNAQVVSAQVTNTTYATLSMQAGDSIANAFGSFTGTDPDFFRLSVFGIDANDQVLPGEIDFLLADYRFNDSANDFIIRDWQTLDLTLLSGASSLHFNLSSSDVGDYGMNTPAYFAIDNLIVNATAVPEPSSLALLGVCTSVGLVRRRKRHRNS